MTDELGLPAEAWRVEPNTSWQWCWLAIQDGPLSRGNGGRVLKITVISNQRLLRQGQRERGDSNLALSYSPRQGHFALRHMNVESVSNAIVPGVKWRNAHLCTRRNKLKPTEQTWFRFQMLRI